MSKEINLLPLARRRLLIRQFFERKLMRFLVSQILALGLVSAAAAAAVLGLHVTGSLFFESVRDELDEAIVAYRVETKSIQDINNVIMEMKQRHDESLTWANLLQDVLAALPPGTTLEEVGGNAETRQLVLRGLTPARSALVVLQERLQKLPWVQEVVAPPANLLERENPQFNFSIRL